VQATRDSFPLGPVLRIDLSLLRVLGVLPASTGRRHAPAAAYALIANGDLDGVHLLEGATGRLAPSFGINNFDDLVHFVALLRWRGSGLSLAARLAAFRNDARAVPATDAVGDVLNETHGWLLFADQLRDVAAALTGWTRAEATAFLAHLADHTPGNLAALRREFFKQTVERSVSLEDATEWFARLVRESESVVERQRMIAECLLTERCLDAKHADPAGFAKRAAEHAGDKKMRYEPPGRVVETEVAVEPAASIPAVDGLTDQLELAGTPKPGPEDLFEKIGSKSPARFTRRNPNEGFVVLSTVSEFHPHPASTPVQLAGRIRNLQTFVSSAEKKVGYFELIDSSGSVRVYVPAEPYQRFGSLLKDGSEVVVRGAVRRRDGRKVCDALEIADSEGGIGFGKAFSNRSSAGDP
jgi:hypothetical protein